MRKNPRAINLYIAPPASLGHNKKNTLRILHFYVLNQYFTVYTWDCGIDSPLNSVNEFCCCCCLRSVFSAPNIICISNINIDQHCLHSATEPFCLLPTTNNTYNPVLADKHCIAITFSNITSKPSWVHVIRTKINWTRKNCLAVVVRWLSSVAFRFPGSVFT